VLAHQEGPVCDRPGLAGVDVWLLAGFEHNLRQGEQHCGERPNTEVWAGPRAEQDCEAMRCGLAQSEAG
jgi:hypothetical protein